MSKENALYHHQIERRAVVDPFESSNKIKYMDLLTEYVDPSHMLEALSDEVRNGAYPVIYSNHNQHGNVVAFMRIAREMSARPEKFYLPVASSLVTGRQNPDMNKSAKEIEPYLQKAGMFFVPLARPEDVSKYRQDGAPREVVKSLLEQTRQNKDFLLQTVNDPNSGLMMFPEATTKGGDRNESGKRNGMVEVKYSLFPEIIKHANEAGRNVVFLPVGMVDTNRILEPRTSKANPRAVFEIAKHKVAGKMGARPSKLSKVVIGDIFRNSDIPVDDGDYKYLNGYFMKKVADLLPEEARGFYK